MPKVKQSSKDYSPLLPFQASDSRSNVNETFKYSGTHGKVKLWLDLATTPIDRSSYKDSISSLVYEGSATISQQKIGNKTYNAAKFDDSDNINALVTFNSTTNALSFGNESSDKPFSVSLFYKRDTATASAAQFYLFGKSDGSSATNNIEFLGVIVPGSSVISFVLYDLNSSNRIGRRFDLDPELYNDKWCHLAFTYDGSAANAGVKIYANGEALNFDANMGGGSYTAMHPIGNKLFVGSNVDGNSETDGNIAEMLFVEKELSQSEVKALYYGTIYGADDVKSGYLNNPPR